MDQLPNFVMHGFLFGPLDPETPQDGDISSTDGPNSHRRWPTPSASMMTEQDQQQAMFAGNDPNRPKYKDANWKTPHGFANTDKTGKTAGAAGEMAKQAVNWPTPRSEDSEQTGAHRGMADTLTSAVRMQSGKKKLNPKFVAWLMNFPPNYLEPTSCGPTEMQSFRSVERKHLSSLLNAPDSESGSTESFDLQGRINE